MDRYANRMVEARVSFVNRISDLVATADAMSLGFFLIYYMAFGVRLHESMVDFLTQASEDCFEKNFDLGQALHVQALIESDASQVMKSNTKKWISYWNQKHNLNLKSADYLNDVMLPSMQAHHELHEEMMNKKIYFAELAVVYELQRMQMIHSFTLIKLVSLKFGLLALRRLEFVWYAMRFNKDSWLNKDFLMTYLNKFPEKQPIMTEKAAAALSIYADFVEACSELAKNDAKKYLLSPCLGH